MRDKLWMTQLILTISLGGKPSFNLKRSYYSYAWSHNLCEGRTSFYMGLTFRKLCRSLLMFSTGFTSLSALLFLYRSLSSFLCMVVDSVSSNNIKEVFSVNLSANVFVSGDFNVHHKDWLTYSGGTDRPGKFCYNFSIRNELPRVVNFPTWSHTVALTICSVGFISFFWC